MTNERQATLFGLSAVLLWSTIATAFKLSLKHLSPIELLLFAGSFPLCCSVSSWLRKAS